MFLKFGVAYLVLLLLAVMSSWSAQAAIMRRGSVKQVSAVKANKRQQRNDQRLMKAMRRNDMNFTRSTVQELVKPNARIVNELSRNEFTNVVPRVLAETPTRKAETLASIPSRALMRSVGNVVVKPPQQSQWNPAKSKVPEISSACPFRLHVFESSPLDPPCMSVTTQQWIAAFQRHPCYSTDPEKANVFISDVETSFASNWPVYNNTNDSNFLRGRDHHTCSRDHLEIDRKAIDSLPFYANRSSGYYEKGAMLFLDHHCNAYEYDWDERNVVLGESISSKFSGHAIPVNAGPVQIPEETMMTMIKEGNCAKKKQAKYKFSFIGSPRDGAPVRKSLIEAFGESNATDTFVSHSLGKPVFWDIMSESQFALAPRGDCLWSYRYQEALSAGAVPVIFADGWMPPFADVYDPASYLVQMQEEKVGDTDSFLRRISDKQYSELCESAQKLYIQYLSSFDGMLDLTLQTLKKWTEIGKGPKQLIMF